MYKSYLIILNFIVILTLVIFFPFYPFSNVETGFPKNAEKQQIDIAAETLSISQPSSKDDKDNDKNKDLIIPLISGIIGALVGALSAYFVTIKQLRANIYINMFNNILSDKDSRADFLTFMHKLKDGADGSGRTDDIKKTVKSSYNQAWFFALFSNCEEMEDEFKNKLDGGDFSGALNIIRLIFSGKRR